MQLLDHIGIKVSDLNRSIRWYRQVLKLEELSFDKWDRYPVMMQGGKSCIALFKGEAPPDGIRKIFHFAFQVTNEEYRSFKKHFTELSIDYRESDHHYFHSVYLIDPDGYEVELTTATGIQD